MILKRARAHSRAKRLLVGHFRAPTLDQPLIRAGKCRMSSTVCHTGLVAEPLVLNP